MNIANQLNNKWISKKLPRRQIGAHKGMFGRVLVVAGSENYPGAAYLSCAAIYRIGAGLVTLTTSPTAKTVIAEKLPEVTFLSDNELLVNLNRYNVLLIGPGLGQSNQTEKLIKQLLELNLPPTVVDADGLNILSKINNWWEKISQETILTPHPGEMARLTGLTIKKIQADRVEIAQTFAQKWQKTVVLKGANTVIAFADGKIMVSPFANPILATAGTGDILAGIIAGLLAQGLTLTDAASLGVYIHGLAGERLSKKIGKAGALASDLLPLLPQILKELA